MPICVENLSYTYAPGTPFMERALSGVSVTIPDGSFVGVMGQTGSGKTTFVRLLAGLMKPTGGRVLLDGHDINEAAYDRRILRKALGVVFQFPEYQLFETTVERDIAFGLRNEGFTKTEILARVREAMATVGLDYDRFSGQSPMALSGGEKRLVAIAGVLAVHPRYLVFDEPIAGLDPLGRQSFLRIVAGLNAAGSTVIMVSHNADCIAEYASRILVFDGGRIAMDGTPEAVFADVQAMNRLHIGVSEPRLVADMLQRRGIAIPQDTVRYDALCSALLQRLQDGAKA